MPTMVVGFRLGNGARQATALVTQTGRLHLASGLYGQLGRASRPQMPSGENPVHARMMNLRNLHAKYTGRGYHEVLIPPACVRLQVEEPPLADGQIHRPDPAAPELVGEFAGAAPSRPQKLEHAIYAFYAAIGAPARPRGPVPTPRPAPAALTPRAAELRRLLSKGAQLTGPAHSPSGYSVTADGVCLSSRHGGARLNRDDVVELHAALTAWLTLNQAGPPKRNTVRQVEKEPRKH
ncbi:hypothetical protein ACFXPQ_01635 [Streptomyces lydicus]|uniref:hypothetical protein n=1 Tax=Streptomyces lydicus TaxID=47763 RepID=UPI00367FD4FD